MIDPNAAALFIVNGKIVSTPARVLAAHDVRRLGGIHADHDLFFEHPGLSEDTLVQADALFAADPPLRFFSAPRDINRG